MVDKPVERDGRSYPLRPSRQATGNATVDERDADMGGGAVFHDNRVEIERL